MLKKFIFINFITASLVLAFYPWDLSASPTMVEAQTCDSTSFTSCQDAHDFGTASGEKSNMCLLDSSTYQYYKITVPSNNQCKISWKVTHAGGSTNCPNYDLYVKWSATCPSLTSQDVGVFSADQYYGYEGGETITSTTRLRANTTSTALV